MSSSRSEILTVPDRLLLYDDPASPTLDAAELAAYLRKTTGVEVDLRPAFFTDHPAEDRDALAERLARTKVKDVYHEEQAYPPLLGDVDIERRLLGDPKKRIPGILYDGFRLQEVLRSLLPEAERSLRYLHLVLTARLIGTFDPGDRVYHARVVACGYPTIVSTSGVVEGPAKPREFYVIKRRYSSVGMTAPTEAIKEEVEGRYIDYDDERLTEILKGYGLQAFFYHLTGDPFCDDPSCRLYNAHWQEEMMEAQLASGELCPSHQGILRGARESAADG